jgi:heme-degrading monooxygenase HmoA
VNAMNVDPEHEAEFNEWYDHEHVPALAAVPGVLAARRFRDNKGTHRYLALYHLREPEATTGQTWKDAASTPWTQRLRPYFRNHLRLLARRYTRAT